MQGKVLDIVNAARAALMRNEVDWMAHDCLIRMR